jgi:hypothetical protein
MKPPFPWNNCADRLLPADIKARVEAEYERVVALLDDEDPNVDRKAQTAMEMAHAWAWRLFLEAAPS